MRRRRPETTHARRLNDLIRSTIGAQPSRQGPTACPEPRNGCKKRQQHRCGCRCSDGAAVGAGMANRPAGAHGPAPGCHALGTPRATPTGRAHGIIETHSPAHAVGSTLRLVVGEVARQRGWAFPTRRYAEPCTKYAPRSKDAICHRAWSAWRRLKCLHSTGVEALTLQQQGPTPRSEGRSTSVHGNNLILFHRRVRAGMWELGARASDCVAHRPSRVDGRRIIKS